MDLVTRTTACLPDLRVPDQSPQSVANRPIAPANRPPPTVPRAENRGCCRKHRRTRGRNPIDSLDTISILINHHVFPLNNGHVDAMTSFCRYHHVHWGSACWRLLARKQVGRGHDNADHEEHTKVSRRFCPQRTSRSATSVERDRVLDRRKEKIPSAQSIVPRKPTSHVPV